MVDLRRANRYTDLVRLMGIEPEPEPEPHVFRQAAKTFTVSECTIRYRHTVVYYPSSIMYMDGI